MSKPLPQSRDDTVERDLRGLVRDLSRPLDTPLQRSLTLLRGRIISSKSQVPESTRTLLQSC